MSIPLTDDVHAVTELKRRTRNILQQVRRTGRPVVVTVNGKADAVIMNARTYEQHLRAANMARLLAAPARGTPPLGACGPCERFYPSSSVPARYTVR
jgi:prevent-host-death family protein